MRHEDMSDGVYVIKTLKYGAVYLQESTGANGTLYPALIKSFNYSQYGVIDPKLVKEIVAHRRYRVAIYPRFPTPDDDFVTIDPGDDATSYITEKRIALANALAPHTEQVVGVVNLIGGLDIVTSALSPFVLATLTGNQLLELRWNQNIDYIELAVPSPAALFADDDASGRNVASLAIQNDVWWSAGYTGTQRTIAIIEAPGIRNTLPYPSSGDEWFSTSIANRSLGGWATMWRPSGYSTWQISAPDEIDATRHTNSVASVAAGTIHDGSGAIGARLVSGNLDYDSTKLGGWDLVDLNAPAENTLAFFPLALNHSYGPAGLVDEPEPYNNSMDFRVRNGLTFEVHACGNGGGPNSAPKRDLSNLNAACNEYNTIKVGGYSTNSTVSWADDEVWINGSWVNPYVRTGGPGTPLRPSDRELPEVMAPAVDVRTANTTWQSGQPDHTAKYTGTSYAAPNVAALATLFMDKFPGFAATPEFVRAAIYATSIHNTLSGMRRAPPDFSAFSKTGRAYSADMRNGFGAVSGKALMGLVATQGFSQGAWQRLTVSESDFQTLSGQTENRRLYSPCIVLDKPCAIGNRLLLPIRLPVTSLPYERIRIVLAWNSRVDCMQCSTDPNTKNFPLDFDMIIVDGTNDKLLRWNTENQNWVTSEAGFPASSLSFDNSYEVIELTPAQTSTLPPNARVELRLFGRSPEKFTERLGYVSYMVPATADIEPGAP